MRDIPQEWIKNYTDKIIALAQSLPEGSPMRTMAALRAEYAMDLVEAFRATTSPSTPSSSGALGPGQTQS